MRLKMLNQSLDQYTDENLRLKFCIRCGHKMFIPNPSKKGLCNRCVAGDEVKDKIKIS
jgi:NADH pyrophosphatase NudC (nudix superfamily)